jgi:hypothetical protein
VTFPNATEEGATPLAVTVDLDAEVARREGRDPGEEGDDTPSDVEQAMLAGYANVSDGTALPPELQETQRKRGGDSDTGDDDETDDDASTVEGEERPDGAPAKPDKQTAGVTDEDENRVIFGGMTAKDLKERLNKIETFEKTASSLAGRVGHIQSVINAKPGKPLTKEDLKSISKEFGEDYAEALASDLNAAGIAGGAKGADPEVIERLVAERTQGMTQETEKKIVRMVHRDAPEYFNGGKQHQAFMAWVGTQPLERQGQILNSWDSDVIVPALDDFKAQRDKAAKEAARAGNRMARAVVPTSGAAANAPAPSNFDPEMAGWESVRGKAKKGQNAARR